MKREEIEKQEKIREFVGQRVLTQMGGFLTEEAKEELFEKEPCVTNDDGNEEQREILEYWAVTGWLGNLLIKRGEAVASDGLMTVWGRTTSGQAVYLDGVIEEIFDDVSCARA